MQVIICIIINYSLQVNLLAFTLLIRDNSLTFSLPSKHLLTVNKGKTAVPDIF